MSFLIYVPLVLSVEELPNCIQGYDGVAEFSDVCASTAVIQSTSAAGIERVHSNFASR